MTTIIVIQDREEQAGQDAMGNIRTAEMNTGIEGRERVGQKQEGHICSGTSNIATHTYTKNPESHLGKKIYLRKWDTLVIKGGHVNNERICASGVPGGYPTHDSRGRGNRRYQEGTREQHRGNPDWRKDCIGGRTKEELFSGCDRWHQDKLSDLWRIL